MFENIGSKIKTLAKIICAIEIVLFALFGLGTAISLFVRDEMVSGVLLGIFYCGIGILSAWISSIFIYGFGELIDNSRTIVCLQDKNLKIQEMLLKNMQTQKVESDKWYCSKCGSEVSSDYTNCPFCEHVEKKEDLKEGFKIVEKE